jgi:hypothetical protein
MEPAEPAPPGAGRNAIATGLDNPVTTGCRPRCTAARLRVVVVEGRVLDGAIGFLVVDVLGAGEVG